MAVGDNTIPAEGLGGFFKSLGKRGLNVSKKMAKNILKNPGRALDIFPNGASPAAPINPKAVFSSLPGVINFHLIGKGLYLGKLV